MTRHLATLSVRSTGSPPAAVGFVLQALLHRARFTIPWAGTSLKRALPYAESRPHLSVLYTRACPPRGVRTALGIALALAVLEGFPDPGCVAANHLQQVAALSVVRFKFLAEHVKHDCQS